MLQPYVSDNDFRSSDYGNDIGYKFYVFDIRYQKFLESAQPIERELKSSDIVPAGVYG